MRKTAFKNGSAIRNLIAAVISISFLFNYASVDAFGQNSNAPVAPEKAGAPAADPVTKTAPGSKEVPDSAKSNAPIVSEYLLPNGLKVVLLEDHSFPVASCMAWYKVGSSDEQAGTTGVSHVLEHMLFGTVGSFKKGEIATSIARVGGQFNGYTSDDFTTFFETVPSNKVELALRIESQRMRGAKFTNADVHEELVNIQREFESESRDGLATLSREVRASLYQNHPYHNPTMGWRSDVEALTAAKVKSYYDKFFRPDRCTMVIAGDISSKQVIVLVQKYFGVIAKAPPVEPSVKTAELPQQAERKISVRHSGKVEAMQVAYHTPAFDHEDSAALMILEKLLNSPYGGRLRTKFVEPKISSSAVSSFEPKKDPGLFAITCTAVPGQCNAQQRISDTLDATINQLRTQLVSDVELRRAKNQAEFSFYAEREGPYRAAFHIGYFDCLAKWQNMTAWSERLREVNAADVQRVAKKYFNNENRVVAWLSGASAPKTAPAKSAPEKDSSPSSPPRLNKPSEHARLTGYKESDEALAPTRLEQFKRMIAEAPLAVERKPTDRNIAGERHGTLSNFELVSKKSTRLPATSRKSETLAKAKKEPAAEKSTKVETVAKTEKSTKSESKSKIEKSAKVETAPKTEKSAKAETKSKAEKTAKAETAPKTEKAAKVETAPKVEPPATAEAKPKSEQHVEAATEATVEKPLLEPTAKRQARVDQAIKEIPSALPAAVKEIPTAIGGAPGSIKELPNAVEAVPEVIRGIPSAIGGIPSAIRELPGAVGSIPSAIKEIPGAIGGLPGAAVNAVRSLPGAIGGLPATAASTIRSIPGTIGSIPGAAATAVKGMPGAIGSMAAEIGSIPGALSKMYTGASPTGLRAFHRTLKNGVRLVVLESRISPVVQIHGAIRAGSAYEAQNKKGLAMVANAVLNNGTSRRSKIQVLSQQEDLGITPGSMLKFSDTPEFIEFTSRALSRDLGAQLDLLAETVTAPALADADFDKAKQDVLSELKATDESSEQKAARTLMQNLLAPTSSFIPEDPSQLSRSVNALSSADARSYIRAYCSPHATTLVLVGDIDPEEAVRLAEKSFTAWIGKGPHTKIHPQPSPRRVLRASVPTKDKTKTTIGFASLVPMSRADSEYTNLLIADALFTSHPLISRVNQRVSSQENLLSVFDDNAVDTKLEPLANSTAWSMVFSVEPNAVPLAVQTLQGELRGLSKTGITPEELVEIKRYLLGAIPVRSYGTLSLSARSLLEAAMHDAGFTGETAQISHIRAATVDSVNRTIRSALKPEQATLVLVGTSQSIRSARRQESASTPAERPE